MKIYTKTGDRGETSIIGGKRLPKHHPRIEAYGTVDELIAWIGLLRSADQNCVSREELISIQSALMTCCTVIATDPSAEVPVNITATDTACARAFNRHYGSPAAGTELIYPPGRASSYSKLQYCTMCVPAG